MATGESIQVQVHETGSAVDRVLRVLRQATGAGSLRATLDNMCAALIEVLEADVVSVYVAEQRDQEPTLTLRGNVGFPPGAVGAVRLRPGEGLVGFAAECLRPVSATTAPRESRYKHVPGLGEEKFPAFVAIPLLADKTAIGVLVLQRRAQRPFTDREITLATALSSAFTLALERTHTESSGAAPGHRSVRLTGAPLVEGATVGVARTLPSFEGLSVPTEHPSPAALATEAFDTLRERLHHTLNRIGAAPNDLGLLLADERLRELVGEKCTDGVIEGLREVARRYALTPYQLTNASEGAWLAQRAAEVEDLCLMVALEAAEETRAVPGSVLLLPERLTTCTALMAIASRAVAVAVAAPVDHDGTAASLLASAGVPAVSSLSGLFSWVRPGDRLLLDGSTGDVRVDPRPSEVARLRRRRARGKRRRLRHPR